MYIALPAKYFQYCGESIYLHLTHLVKDHDIGFAQGVRSDACLHGEVVRCPKYPHVILPPTQLVNAAMDKVAAIHLNINETQRQLPRPLKDAPFDYYRYKRHTDNELICPLCRVAQETELHFVLCCPVLSALRVQFIPSKFYRFPSLFRLSLLLAPMKIL